MKAKVCVVGAGPAGLMAAIHSAAAGAPTIVVEANTTAGRKLLLTGGGRCNLTHQASPAELVRAFGPKGRFLRHSLYEFPPDKARQFFHRLGLESTVDRTGCVFPATQRASDVRDILLHQANTLGVRFCYDGPVVRIVKEAHDFAVHTGRNIIAAAKVIIATGGLSWPQTGSTGDGYRFARDLGHHIIEPKPALVPLVTRESWPAQLAGTTIEDVKISAAIQGRKVSAAGPMLFTDDGIAGPAVLDLSRSLTDFLPDDKNPIEVFVDLVPGLSHADLEGQFIERAAANPKKTTANIVSTFVPRRIASVLCTRTGCDADLLANQVKKDIRRRLVRILKALPLSIVRTRPIAEATVTRAGVSTEEIDPKTMQSKICPGLFFAGEVIDVDGPCGGYNLQICWATGAIAGGSGAKNL